MSDDEKIQVRNKIRLTDHGSPQLVIGRVSFRPVPTTDFIYEDAVRQVTGQVA